MESALDVLSRAATMVQDNANEARLSSKELPTTAWRRERRLRTGEYQYPHNHHPSPRSSNSTVRASSPSLSPPSNVHVHNSSLSTGSAKTNMRSNAHQISIMMAAAASIHSLNESTSHPPSPSPPPQSHIASQIHLGQITHSHVLQHISSTQNDDAPLDMSVSSLKQRNSPPPPYREPLPGSQFTSSLARPSVITQAPPKRDVRDSSLVTNRESDNRSSESIDEHFRRSLGNEYFSLFAKRSPANLMTKSPSPQPHNPQPTKAHIRSSSPILPMSSGVSIFSPKPTLTQSELNPPPAYPVILPSSNHSLAASSTDNVLLSPVVLATEPNSPPLSLVVRSNTLHNHQHTNVKKSSPRIAITPLTSPKSPAPSPCVKLGTTQTTGSKTASPLPNQQQSPVVAVTLSHLTSVVSSPVSSPRHTPPLNVPAPNPSLNIPAIMRIKTEPGLQNVKSNNPTPPASPTSTTNYNIHFNSTSNSSNTSSPSSPKTSSWKTSKKANKKSAEVLASVDDHFAKALGDTWKKLQESKEMRK